MSGLIGSVKPRVCIEKLKRAGYLIDHQTGSHVILRNETGRRLVVPFHAKDMKRGLLLSIIKEAGLSIREFQTL